MTGVHHPDAGVPALRPGDIVAGRYEIEGVAGEGGMAVVFSARHLHLQERFAIKVLRPLYASGRATVSRFMQEARAAAQLRSEHICRVFDVGLLPDGAPYIVMELLEGSSLGEVLARGERLTIEEVVEYTLQACEALTEAHARGVIHRDIKPENLFLTKKPDGWRAVKLVDFGISKVVDTDALDTSIRRHRDTGNMLGTPHYMAPEQVRSSREVDARSDLWSLGVVLYELLAERLPFDGMTVPEISARILESEPTNLALFRPDLPPEIVEAVHWCLSKQPELRISSAYELATSLMPFGPRRSRAVVERMQSLARKQGDLTEIPASTAPPPMPGFVPVEIPTMSAVPTIVSEPEEKSSITLVWIAAAVAIGVMIVGGLVLHFQSSDTPTSRVEPAVESVAPPIATPTPPLPGQLTGQATPQPQPPPPPEPVRATPRGKLGPMPVAKPAEPTPTPAPHVTGKPTWDNGPDMGF